MLANAFSYLPIYWDEKWYFVSDYAVARFLREAPAKRKARMAMTIGDLLKESSELLVEAISIPEGTAVPEVIGEIKGGVPILVRGVDERHLVGIISPADLL